MQLDGLDLNLVRALHALLEEASVTRASKRLGLSVPATSHALARLRTRLEDPLLERAGRGMVRTPRAEALREPVQRVIEGLAQVLSPAEVPTAASLSRRFVVHASDYVLGVFGVALDRRVREEAPQVDLRFRSNLPEEDELLREGRIDAAIGAYGKLPPEVRTRTLFNERLVCALRRDHPVRRLTVARYAELGHVQVAPRGLPGSVIDRLLARRGLSRRVERQVPFFHSALDLLAETDLVLTAPERFLRRHADPSGLRVLPCPLEPAPYRVRLIWHPRMNADAGHRWLRQTIADVAKTVE